ncbi:ABC transporter permease [Nocardioides limicola]|uniref:ABC transporter permease n=1 Tax=Nocardioides limicola TaxID=2803368 RepID=UPI00193B2911|nr:FtsX-like permease family protein [Nocardioides sp. DJM-14]
MIRLTLRNLVARKVRLLMSALAVVLGVAFLSGVLVFSNGLQATFDQIIKGTTPSGLVRAEGSASFSAGEGGVSTATLSPQVAADLEALPEVARADGNVDGFGMHLLAKDGSLVGGGGPPTLAFNYVDTPNLAGEQILELSEGRWPTEPGEIALDGRAADNGDYQVGDQVRLIAPYGELERDVTLVGTADFAAGGMAGAVLIMFDTAGAQEIFLDGADAYTSISLTGADGVSQTELAEAAAAVLPDGFEAVTADVVIEESEDAIGAFLGVISTFLLVFAVIAVVVGGFIIVNTFAILVAQRSRELALLRALGASRRQVSRSVLFEALVMGVVASSVGILAGWALARGLAALLGAFGLEVAGSRLTLDAGVVAVSYAVGVGVTVLAAWIPARRAGRVAPVAAMRADSVAAPGSLRRRAWIGAGVLLIGAGLAAAGLLGAPGPSALWVGAAALLWLLTVAVISSVLGRPVLAACRALFSRTFGAPGRLAGENAMRDPRRTGATASALMIGLTLVSLIGVLASSLNRSIDDLIDADVTSDFIVQSATYMPFPAAIGDRLEEVDGVGPVSREQWVQASVDGESTFIAGYDALFTEIYRVEMVSGEPAISGHQALISDKTAEDRDFQLGDQVALTFPGGTQIDVTVAGVMEANNTLADVAVPLDLFAEAGLARQDNAVSILLADGADPEAVYDALKEAALGWPMIGVFDMGDLGEQIRGQVNQLLFLIYGLLALAIVIAVIGIVNTLGLSVIERTREIGLLRAIGMTRSQLRRMITGESVAVAVLGAVLGLGLGVLSGTLLQQALSDDLTSLGVPVGQLALFLAVAVVVGVLAAALPAARAARLDVLEAIATE